MGPATLHPAELNYLARKRQAAPTGKDMTVLREAAEDVESFFLTQMMELMWKDVNTGGITGGGNGEKTFRSFMMDEYGKQIAKNGQLGIADAVLAQLIRYQEAANGEK